MADLSDVGNTLVGTISGFLYPNGTGQPSAAGFDARIYPGWPDPLSLDKDMAANVAHISVFPHPNGRNTTRYPGDWQTINAPVQTLTAAVAGNVVTLGGTVATPQNVIVLANGAPFVYAVQAADTLATIASALATLIAAGIPGTTSTGSAITLPTSARGIVARISASGTVAREVRRQEHTVQVTVWAPSPSTRAALVVAFDALLSDLRFLTLPDSFGARLIYANGYDSDKLNKSLAYRRDMLYTVDFATTITQQQTQIGVIETNVTPAVGGVAGSSPTFTTYQ